MNNNACDNIIIKADYREVSSKVPKSLNEQGIAPEITCLKSGDYQINQQWLIERKTLTDLVQSIIDGRLFRQLGEIQKTGLRPVLLLEGSSAQLKHSKMSRESIQGALLTISLFMGIPVLRSLNPEETASLLITIARQQARYKDPGFAPSFTFQPKRPKGKYQNQLHILQTLPGIGTQKAKALLKKFGTIENIIVSSAERLAETEGIGKATAEKIQWVLREEPSLYQ